jgi:hypothetical protein
LRREIHANLRAALAQALHRYRRVECHLAGGMIAAFTGLAGLFALTPLVSTLLFFVVLWQLQRVIGS